MKLRDYLQSARGKSILSSADAGGKVTSALYSAPHVFEDGTVAFVMRRKLTHENLQANPYASYMFIEDGDGYRGVRLYLKKVREGQDSVLMQKMNRRGLTPEEDRSRGPKFLVYFRVDKLLPLIGDGPTEIVLV